MSLKKYFVFCSLLVSARNGEALCEGFEDVNYAENINKDYQNICNKYIDFSGVGNIINNDTSATLKAHSGKYLLSVNGNTQAVKTFNITQFSNVGYNFNFGSDTSKDLNTKGGNFSFVSHSGSYWDPAIAYFGTSIHSALFGKGEGIILNTLN